MVRLVEGRLSPIAVAQWGYDLLPRRLPGGSCLFDWARELTPVANNLAVVVPASRLLNRA